MPAPFSGQVSLTASAQQVDPTTAASSCTAFSIKAPLSNANPAYIGRSGVTIGTGYQLDPGDEFSYERISQSGVPRYESQPSDFWAVGTSGDKVCWLGSL